MVTSKGNVATIMSEMQRLLSISKAGLDTFANSGRKLKVVPILIIRVLLK